MNQTGAARRQQKEDYDNAKQLALDGKLDDISSGKLLLF